MPAVWKAYGLVRGYAKYGIAVFALLLLVGWWTARSRDLDAMARALWTPLARKDINDFSARLGVHLARLARLDVNYRPLK